MLRLDERTANVLTTAVLFAAVIGAVYAARVTVVVLVLALLFAYLLEPAVSWVQSALPAKHRSRPAAIAIVYLLTIAVVAGCGFAFAPAIAGRVPHAGGQSSLQPNQAFLAEHRTLMSSIVERSGAALAAAASRAGWLAVVPIIAIFFLANRAGFIDATVGVFARYRDRATVKRIVERIDTLLAQYIRAQLLLAGLSAAFYAVAMIACGCPYPIPLGLLGGALEFIPMIGWLLAGVVMVSAGWLAHAQWIAMIVAILVWRGVQNFINSPRIMGNRLQLEPLTVIVALMAGGQIGGLLGVVLAIPTVAVLRILWLEHTSDQNAAAA